MLYGRAADTATIDALLADARAGTSGVLVLRGEAGIGKSTLLDDAVRRAEGFDVLRVRAVESEQHLPYAGLHLLIGRHTEAMSRLPPPQADALAGALGTGSAAPRANRFLVGLAVLTLLADLAERSPLLCLIDDAQWLDQESAEALLLAARRLDVEPVALLLAVREGPQVPVLSTAGLPERSLERLDVDGSRAVLEVHAPDLADHVRDQVLVEADGNPLALLALADARRRGLGRHDGPGTPLLERTIDAFAGRAAALPDRTRRLLTIAAAEDAGDVGLVLRAASRWGLGVDDLEPAEAAGLLRVEDGRLVFGHPLMRSAVTAAAPLHQRLDAHRALAGELDVVTDGHRRAWHLASAATGPDEAVAAALEASAHDARVRGGHAAVTAAYERAAELTPDPAARARRTVDAAAAATDAGQFARAETLLGSLPELPLDAGTDRRRREVRATLAEVAGRPAEAHQLLVELARESDAAEAESLLLRAVDAAWSANDYAAVAAVAAPTGDLTPGPVVRSLAAAATAAAVIDDEHVVAGPVALHDLLRRLPRRGGDTRQQLLVGWLHLISGDIDAATEEAAHLQDVARRDGALGVLPQVLLLAARSAQLQGRHREARIAATDGLRLAADTGQHDARYDLLAVLAWLAAVEGDAEGCSTSAAEPIGRGVAPASVHATSALALLDLGTGRFDEAFRRLEGVLTGTNCLGAVGSLPLLVEAAVRVGELERGRDAAALYTRWAEHVDRPWALALAARCRALLGDEGAYAEATALDGSPFERARTQLLHGEHLRRSSHASDARTRLRPALETFERLGAEPWATRARAELRATGESRGVDAEARDLLDRLTPQELQVVLLAARGLTNRDIGAQLFLSPRTVGHHLYKAFPKLGVASRAELAALVAGPTVTGGATSHLTDAVGTGPS